MQRRGFPIRLTQAGAVPGTLPTTLNAHRRHGSEGPLRGQDRRIADSHCYDGQAILPSLLTGDPLTLRHRLDKVAVPLALLDRHHALHPELIGIDRSGSKRN